MCVSECLIAPHSHLVPTLDVAKWVPVPRWIDAWGSYFIYRLRKVNIATKQNDEGSKKEKKGRRRTLDTTREREKERDIESLSLVEILVPCWSQSQIQSQSRWVNGMVHVQCAYVQVWVELSWVLFDYLHCYRYRKHDEVEFNVCTNVHTVYTQHSTEARQDGICQLLCQRSTNVKK